MKNKINLYNIFSIIGSITPKGIVKSNPIYITSDLSDYNTFWYSNTTNKWMWSEMLSISFLSEDKTDEKINLIKNHLKEEFGIESN